MATADFPAFSPTHFVAIRNTPTSFVHQYHFHKVNRPLSHDTRTWLYNALLLLNYNFNEIEKLICQRLQWREQRKCIKPCLNSQSCLGSTTGSRMLALESVTTSSILLLQPQLGISWKSCFRSLIYFNGRKVTFTQRTTMDIGLTS